MVPYLDLGLPVLVGSEPLIPPAMARGAVGAVSGLASAFPDVVRGALDQPDDGRRGAAHRAARMMERQPFIAAAKHVLRDAASRSGRTCAARCGRSRPTSSRRWMPPSMRARAAVAG